MERRILIIEDNETNLELMVYLLQEHGYQPLTAEDGQAGLALIQREKPDLVLCDIQLPKLNGYEVAQHMKASPELRAIPIVAVTALAMVGDRERGLAAGFDGYISKPIDTKNFVPQVEIFMGLTKAEKGLILVVDDLSANTKLLESLLEPFGYRTIVTSGMTEAMQLARKHQPNLIISDVQMHEGNGYELCEALKTDPRLKNIPVILITSTYSDESARKKGLALGAARFIFRPVDSPTLLREIEDCLAGKK